MINIIIKGEIVICCNSWTDSKSVNMQWSVVKVVGRILAKAKDKEIAAKNSADRSEVASRQNRGVDSG